MTCLSHLFLVTCLPGHWPTHHSSRRVLFPGMYFSNAKQPIQSPHLNCFPLWGSYTPGYCLPALPTPGSGARQLGTDPMLQKSKNLFKLANPKPACPPHPIPSCRRVFAIIAVDFGESQGMSDWQVLGDSPELSHCSVIISKMLMMMMIKKGVY